MNKLLLGVRNNIVSLWVVVHLAVAGSALAAVPAAAPDIAAQKTNQAGGHVIQLTLKELGVQSPLRLVGGDVQSDIDFSFHTLDVVERLRLKMHYSYSPTLDPETSFLKVNLNGQGIATLPLPRNTASNAHAVIEIDPILVQEWNHLSFQFVAHQEKPLCDDPRSPQTWIQLNHRDTVIEADAVTLPLSNDLSFFPVPFFDKHDTRDLVLPFVLPEHPSWGALKSAGILASWFGGLADWRKVQFPSHLNEIPDRDAIVLATVQDRIDGIELPPVTGARATISMVANPRNRNARLLLVVGRDEAGLIEAAQALVSGKVPLAGDSQNVSADVRVPKRQPFDAPKWLPADRKIRLGEIVPQEQLTARGLFVTPLKMVLHLPPNLYRAETSTIPFDFLFESSSNSRYLVRVDAYLNGVAFQYETFNKPLENINGMSKGRVLFNIPTRNITGRDTITLQFTFAEKNLRICTTDFVKDEIRIDPGSMIDLKEVPRYLELPDLSYLAYTGYPFSKQADLSETAVLLPLNPDRHEIESMLNVLGHIGNKTGFPAAALTVAPFTDAKKFAAKDILVIGAAGHIRPLLEDWKDHIQVNLLSDSQPIPRLGSRYFQRWAEWGILSAKLNRAKGGKAMVLAGFQSPLQAKQSVVMLTAADSASLPEETSALNTFSLSKDFAGDVVAIAEANTYDRVVAFERAPRYAIGELPLFEQARKFVYHNPWLAVLIAVVIALFFASMSYRKLRRISQDKLRQGSQ